MFNFKVLDPKVKPTKAITGRQVWLRIKLVMVAYRTYFKVRCRTL
jgi:hypothetical protein